MNWLRPGKNASPTGGAGLWPWTYSVILLLRVIEVQSAGTDSNRLYTNTIRSIKHRCKIRTILFLKLYFFSILVSLLLSVPFSPALRKCLLHGLKVDLVRDWLVVAMSRVWANPVLVGAFIFRISALLVMLDFPRNVTGWIWTVGSTISFALI